MLIFILPIASLLIWIVVSITKRSGLAARWAYSVGSALYGAGINYLFFHYGSRVVPPSMQQFVVPIWIATIMVLFWIGWSVGKQLDSKPYTRNP
ncbi:MAG: hypothetical protein JWQ89_3406 [Devosia sp.]|nr:hypothetical protein [Devosia sp.]